MEAAEGRLWLSLTGLPWQATDRILREYGTAEIAYAAWRRQDGSFDWLNPARRENLARAAEPRRLEGLLKRLRRDGIRLLTAEDPAYPVLLKHIADPPHVLYCQGNPACLQGRCLTMVGSRRASPGGLEAARRIARGLGSAGVTVVSGLAMGIDAASHEGCLQGAGKTAAVLGCGLDLNYPAENERLRRRILETGGVLLSEYPLGTPALPANFPVRNRILSGLSRATAVVECLLKSGAMLTVESALDQGRTVYAYPGDPTSPYSEGAHSLLREGARYFTTAEDLLEDMDWEPAPAAPPAAQIPMPALNAAQAAVLTELAKGNRSFEELSEATGLDAAGLSGNLTMLQLMGLIRPMAGKTYGKV